MCCLYSALNLVLCKPANISESEYKVCVCVCVSARNSKMRETEREKLCTLQAKQGSILNLKPN